MSDPDGFTGTHDAGQKATFPWHRIPWLVAIILVQLIYVPINRIVRGGVILQFRLDAHIPLWPMWAVPYLLSIVWWQASFVWAACKMESDRFRAFAVGTIAVMLTSYVVYIFYPTYVERPVVEDTGWAADLIRLIYRNDRLHNAFPSGHTYTTMLIVFFWWSWKPHLRWLWAAAGVIVILSTLFTGQHNLPDPVGGLLWAWAGYRFGQWWVDRRAKA
jgi:membrane-associated phospholipid phosphatase